MYHDICPKLVNPQEWLYTQNEVGPNADRCNASHLLQVGHNGQRNCFGTIPNALCYVLGVLWGYLLEEQLQLCHVQGICGPPEVLQLG
jgi:hypothetical protein